jgi:7-carboxy-7-deazaguanine synthase
MSYAVKEIFLTLQGEGAHVGRVSVFCRFAGCNLWSGRESDRASATCRFCDTDFVGMDGTRGGRYDAATLARALSEEWIGDPIHKFCVLTGGEPLLQVDKALLEALHAEGFVVAVETNGTVTPPNGIDWLCVSPKAGAELVVSSADELKLVYPQIGAEPERYAAMDFKNFFLQPMDGEQLEENTQRAVNYCLKHPQWRLSVQTHKKINIR